jgi:phosphate transport system permease protein
VAHLTSRRFVAEVPEFPSGVITGGLAPRRDGVFAVTADGTVHRWFMSLPHPEATVRTLFGPVVYEGFGAPELVWQTTGGSGGSFEPKISLVPLLLGTFKGALYALLFSAPCALLAALYVSQFASPRLRRVSKPMVELMAALPSVVVGFLAALVLAPLLQRNLVGTLSALAALPAAIIVAGLIWGVAPLPWRRRLAQRGELAMVAAVIGVPLVLVFALQERLEGWLFQGDLQSWLLQAAGISYDQRNAVVVGFALGFAVIPIIFTLAEDAFSNVPPSLISPRHWHWVQPPGRLPERWLSPRPAPACSPP